MQLLRVADLFVRLIANDRLDAGKGDAEGLEDLLHLLATTSSERSMRSSASVKLVR